MTQFIGRAEKQVKKILEEIYPFTLIIPQYPIRKLIPNSDYQRFDEEIQKHSFDMVVFNPVKLIVEVNYKHGEKAARKWRTIFVPMINNLHLIPVTVDDYECDSIFRHDINSTKPLNKADYQDVINALNLAGIINVKWNITIKDTCLI